MGNTGKGEVYRIIVERARKQSGVILVQFCTKKEKEKWSRQIVQCDVNGYLSPAKPYGALQANSGDLPRDPEY